MKINIIIPGIGLSGGIRVLFKYAELLNKNDVDVLFYTPILAYDVHNCNSILINKAHVITNTCKRINAYRIKKSQLNTGFNVKVQAIPVISDRYIRDADIVMASAWPTAFSVNKLGENKGKKVYFIQDYEIWNNKELGMKSYTLPLKHIVISTWIKKQLELQLKKVDTSIVYDGLDLNIFNNKRNHYFTGKGTFTILMLYHNLPKKGIEDGIAAYELIKKEYPQTKLVMFGLEKNPSISKEIEYYFDPSREVLSQLYSMSDVFLYTSREEGWGLTPLEAMASGCPVVGTNTGCMLDIGDNGQNVLLSEPYDVDGLVDNLRKIILTPELSKSIAEKAYECVQQFSWENAALKLKNKLEEICDENPK